jgi:hypothetical protein
MDDVEESADGDQDRHDDDVCLHDGGRYKRRKLSEGIAGEHARRFPDVPNFAGTVAVAAAASQSFD